MVGHFFAHHHPIRVHAVHVLLHGFKGSEVHLGIGMRKAPTRGLIGLMQVNKVLLLLERLNVSGDTVLFSFYLLYHHPTFLPPS